MYQEYYGRIGLRNLLPHEAKEYWNDTLSKGKSAVQNGK